MLGMIKETFLLICLFICAWVDQKEEKVYLWMPAFFSGIGAIFQLIQKSMSIGMIAGGVAIGGICLLLSWITNESIGFGDGLVFVMTGIYLGFMDNLELFVMSLLLSGMAALFFIVIKRIRKGDRMPCVPFDLAAYVGMLI